MLLGSEAGAFFTIFTYLVANSTQRNALFGYSPCLRLLPDGDLLYPLSRTKPLVLAVPVTIRSEVQEGGIF